MAKSLFEELGGKYEMCIRDRGICLVLHYPTF